MLTAQDGSAKATEKEEHKDETVENVKEQEEPKQL